MTSARPSSVNPELEIDFPDRQKRWTVLLAIPHLAVMFFLSIAVIVTVVIGWFAALMLGRLPCWAHRFIRDFAQRPPTTPATPRQVLNCCAAARAAAALEKPPTSPDPPASVSYRTAHDERPVLHNTASGTLHEYQHAARTTQMLFGNRTVTRPQRGLGRPRVTARRARRAW